MPHRLYIPCTSISPDSCTPLNSTSLLAFINKYGVLTNQWTWWYETLLEVSMTKIALCIRVCADDWAAESAIKASNEPITLRSCIHLDPMYSLTCTPSHPKTLHIVRPHIRPDQMQPYTSGRVLCPVDGYFSTDRTTKSHRIPFDKQIHV